MGTLSDYFNQNAYKPSWFIGDRVFGYWNKIPFIGTVGNDTDKIGDSGPRVTVHLDLPIMVDNEIKSFIIVKPKELTRLTSFDETPKAKK
jgi:hypothetical protein